MQRRGLLAACTTTGVLGGLAGCSNSAETVDGTVTRNEVEGLTITNHIGDSDGHTYVVEVDVENTGSEDTDASSYDYLLTPYNEAGEDITDVGEAVKFDGDPELPAGETIEVEIAVDTTENALEVQRYEIGIECSSFDENAPYCAN